MFGHQDETKQSPADDSAATTIEPSNDNTQHGGDTGPADSPVPDSILGTPAIEEHETDGFTATDVGSPASDNSAGTDSYDSPSGQSDNNGNDANALLDIKQQALQQLTPLVGHLDQTPEEKFRTTMMMIQASDNKDLLKTAYDAAQQIGDEKVRAQALLDVINEINYFTQHSDN